MNENESMNMNEKTFAEIVEENDSKNQVEEISQEMMIDKINECVDEVNGMAVVMNLLTIAATAYAGYKGVKYLKNRLKNRKPKAESIKVDDNDVEVLSMEESVKCKVNDTYEKAVKAARAAKKACEKKSES